MHYHSLIFTLRSGLALNPRYPFERIHRLAEASPQMEAYFDERMRESFQALSRGCFHPLVDLLTKTIQASLSGPQPIRISLAISGLFMEQASKYDPRLIDTLKSLVATRSVELLGTTHYDSLCSIFSDQEEFRAQVSEQKDALKRHFAMEPKCFVNTKLVHNNRVATQLKQMAFESAIIDDPLDQQDLRNVLGQSPPPHGLLLIPRSRRLSEGIGTLGNPKEESDRQDKIWGTFSRSLATRRAYSVSVVDPRAYGHVGQESNLSHLETLLGRRSAELVWATPSDLAGLFEASSLYSVPEARTISQVDQDGAARMGIENILQRQVFDRLEAMTPYVREVSHPGITKIWRMLQQVEYLESLDFPEGSEPGTARMAGQPLQTFSVLAAILNDFEWNVAVLVQRARKSRHAGSTEQKPPPHPSPEAPTHKK